MAGLRGKLTVSDARLLTEALHIILPRGTWSHSKRLRALDLTPCIDHRQGFERTGCHEITAEQRKIDRPELCASRCEQPEISPD